MLTGKYIPFLPTCYISIVRPAVILFAVCIGLSAQDEPVRFGTTVVLPAGLRGQIYHIRRNSIMLPDFEKLKPRGTIYTSALDIVPQDFRQGFPGVTKRMEWFAIDYTGRFWKRPPVRTWPAESTRFAFLIFKARVFRSPWFYKSPNRANLSASSAPTSSALPNIPKPGPIPIPKINPKSTSRAGPRPASRRLLLHRLPKPPLHRIIRVRRHRPVAPQPPHHVRKNRAPHFLPVQIHAPRIIHVIALLG
jgi:hypothetical protein